MLEVKVFPLYAFVVQIFFLMA